jgi:acyl carrier protein
MCSRPGTAVLYGDDILEKLRSLLCGRLDIDKDALHPETALEDIGFDSVELAFVLSHFERNTGFSFDDAEVEVSRYRTIGDVVDLLVSGLAHETGEADRQLTSERRSAG